MLTAVLSFTLLTAATTTSELQVEGTVDENFRGAYDILVRPEDAATELEAERGLVRVNYLGGTFGGITREQYETILGLEDVSVAAPIANIGYVPASANLVVPMNDLLEADTAQLYRVELSWKAHGGSSTYPQGTTYLYYSGANEMVADGGNLDLGAGPILERLPDGTLMPVCIPFNLDADATPRFDQSGPFDRIPEYLRCFGSNSADGFVGASARLYPPILLAAIDPEQERELVELDSAVVEGRYLRPGEDAPWTDLGPWDARIAPVLVSSETTVDQDLEVVVERLRVPEGTDFPAMLSDEQRVRDVLPQLEGEVIDERIVAPDDTYRELLENFRTVDIGSGLLAYWLPGDVTYRATGDGESLTAVAGPPDEEDWGRVTGAWTAPPGNQDVQFRSLEIRPGTEEVRTSDGSSERQVMTAGIQVVGTFDPNLLPGFSELSAVPLETYYPPEAVGADTASREALGGESLQPSMNIGDYLQQPPLMLTTLDAAEAFLDPEGYVGTDPSAPISSIRVRVDGVTGVDAVSLERIRRVAQAISDGTGLTVDFTAGSSPTSVTVELPPGDFGRPALTLSEPWVRKGTALEVVQGVDVKSVALLGLILLVCALFVGNAGLAAVRGRRQEIATLRALGWGTRAVFAATLGEVVVLGLVAGVLGAGLAAGLVVALDLDFPLQRILVAPLIGLGIAVVAGLVPALVAGRLQPLEALRPPSLAPRRERPTRTLSGMAMVNLRREPSRTLVGAAGLVVGVAGLTVLIAVNRAFDGLLDDTLLGEALAVDVRPADYLSLLFVGLLGAVGVADVTYLNLRERAAELLTLQSTGWSTGKLLRLALTEVVVLSGLAALVGTLVGVATVVVLAGSPGELGAAALVWAAGVAFAVLASVVALRAVIHLPAPTTLAQE